MACAHLDGPPSSWAQPILIDTKPASPGTGLLTAALVLAAVCFVFLILGLGMRRLVRSRERMDGE